MIKPTPPLLVVCLLISILLAGCSSEEKRPPNIIYVMADDLGFGDVGCYGQQIIKTPNIDQLAAEGIRFTDFYSGSTVCAPSRCALMTGKHTGFAYIRGNSKEPMQGAELTIAEFLKQQGYYTGMFGKWGLGEAGTEGSPENQGWDEFLGYTDQRHAHHSYTDSLAKIENGKTVYFKNDSSRHSHLTIMEAAFNFLKNNKQKPFFLYLPVTIPHAEIFSPTQEAMASYLFEGKSNFEETPFVRTNGTYRSQAEPRSNFAGMVSQLDTDMGRLLQLLKELGLDENTYIFFTSDNGPHQEGGADPVFFDSNGPLKGIKRDLYEGGIRVPMIVRAPGKIQANTVTHTPFANWDVLPTIAEMTQKDSPANLNGISFYQTLLGNETTAAKARPLYWEFYERGFDQALRKGDWKAVRRKNNNNKLELYNLGVDIGEANDVAERYPDIANEMAVLMDKNRVNSNLWKPKE